MKRKLRLFGVLIACLWQPLPSMGYELPELGDSSATVLSALQEQAIAEQILHDVAVSDEVVRDPELNDYVSTLGNKLVANGPDKRLPFHFFIVQDNTINAFAMPGGVIGVHTGLLLAANSESELAGVLGHEIGHVTQHHLARLMAAQKNATFTNIASMALALLVARSNPQLAAGAMTTAQAATVQNQLDYTREHEREADRIGVQILEDAGFDVRGMPAFFNTLMRGSRFVDGKAPSFLRTHPLTTERIADVENRVGQMAYKQVADSVEFHLVRAKLRANAGLPQAAAALFMQEINEGRYGNLDATHYGLAVAYLRADLFDKAEGELNWLKQHAKPHAMFANLGAQLAFKQNNPAKAGQLYQAAIAQYPESRAIIFGYAAHLLALKQADKAQKFLKEKLAIYPDDADLYNMLAKAYSLQNKQLLSHQALAEAEVRKYDIARAAEQLELASKAKDGDFYAQSSVEARLKELRRQLENQKDK